MDSSRLEYLFQGYLLRTITAAEELELLAALQDTIHSGKKSELIEAAYNNLPLQYTMTEEQANTIFATIIAAPETVQAPVRKMNWKKWVAAASVLLVLGLGSYLLFFNKSKQHVEIAQTTEERFKNDVAPGGYKARLTLADGSQIILDSAAIGELTKQGGTVVINKDGQLIYNSPPGVGGEVLYNTLSTAKGETYATVLADGSKVWLNSGSSIKYPVAFTSNERKVEITGEAYFEVAKDKTKPFIVSSNKASITVLGTHFNVNGYSDESAMKVTLLEGSVKVSTQTANSILRPGEQAQVSSDIKVASGVDLDEVMAWKNGRFLFESADIKTIMRQIERWYDVEVEYKDDIRYSFVVDLSRNVPISEMLRSMELTNLVHFKIEGKKITVIK